MYDRYAEQVYNYCLRLTGSPEDAGDATQEAFVNVLRRLQEDDRPVLEFSSYLFAAARHESYALMRQRARTHPTDSPPAERGRVADLETDPERSVLLRDSQEAVRDANAQLPPRHREVLALREVAGRSYEEIGATMGISENAAAQLILRARSKLREAMTAGAVASVVATTDECETAQMLLSRVQDGEPVEEADRIWLEEHLDECGSCKTANRMLLEVGASYRLWLPVGLLAAMRTDTLTRAGELVGADWSHVPTPGKGAAGSSAGASAGTAGGVGAAAAATAAVIAAAAIGGLALLRDDEAGAPVDPVAKKPAASAPEPAAKSTPKPERDAKAAPADTKLVASRALGSLLAPARRVLAHRHARSSERNRRARGPERAARIEPAAGSSGAGRRGAARPAARRQPRIKHPGATRAGSGAAGGTRAEGRGAGATRGRPGKARGPRSTRGPVPPVDPTVPPTTEEPVCTFPGRGTGPDECPPGQGGDPPGDGGTRPPGDGTGDGSQRAETRGLLQRLLDRLLA